MMREHEINKLDNFIMGWYMDDTSLCDRIINAHKAFPNKKEGVAGALHQINKNVKDSIDIFLNQADKQLFNDYVNNCLDAVTKEYKKKYPYCDSCSPWGIVEDINVQHYKPNGGFYAWHTERGEASGISSSRHLVFMTYLNDVTDEGETEFFHQKLKVRPEKGLTLIWPVDWTFTHRGIPSSTEEKYITTGWFNFV
jgi:hypothetical protein